MAQYPATGQWAIYSVQLNLLGVLGDLSDQLEHNFLVLVDPQGNAVLEMQGVYSGTISLFNPTGITSGNYLQVEMKLPNQYLSDETVLGTPQLVAQGSETAVLSAFDAAFSTAASAINTTQDFYAADDGSLTRNSNSVWYTAMLSLQGSSVSRITNPIPSYVKYNPPGESVNLATAGSNNSTVLNGGTDTSFPTNPTQDYITSSGEDSPAPIINIDTGGYILGVMNQAQTQLLYYIVSPDADPASSNWNTIASQLGTFSSAFGGSTISITGARLQALNVALGGSSTLSPGGIVYVPTSVATSVPAQWSGVNYVYDPNAGVYYTTIPTFGTSGGQVSIETSGAAVDFAANTVDGSTTSGSTATIMLSTDDPVTLGTLDINTSTGAGTLTLANDGMTISLSDVAGDDVLTPSSSDTPEEALIAYLGDLGDTTTASALDTANFNYQHPMESGPTISGTISGSTDYFILAPDNVAAPGAVVTGVSGYTNTLGANDRPL